MIRTADEKHMIFNAANTTHGQQFVDFVLDNGASVHVCGDREAFVEWDTEQLVLTWIGET